MPALVDPVTYVYVVVALIGAALGRDAVSELLRLLT
jgi:hypothetical protein